MNSLELCLKLLDDLDAHGRDKVARKINSLNKEALTTVRDHECGEECNKLCDAIFEATGLLVKGKSRETMTINARRYVCKVLRDMGFTYLAIGKALGINHSSVIFHVRKADDAEKYARFYPEYHDIKKKVIAKLYSSS